MSDPHGMQQQQQQRQQSPQPQPGSQRQSQQQGGGPDEQARESDIGRDDRLRPDSNAM